MKLEATHLDGLFIIHLTAHSDPRGSFHEAFNTRTLFDLGIPIKIEQVNVSTSIEPGTVRGMHWQASPHGQTKIVRCIHGEIIDVVVDVRPESPTYGQYKPIWLKEYDLQMVYIPQGFAHGWQAIRECSQIEYFVSGPWNKEAERGLHPEDRKVGIIWPKPVVQLNSRDASWPPISPPPSHPKPSVPGHPARS